MISGDEPVASARPLLAKSQRLDLRIHGGIPKDEDLFVDDDHLLMMFDDG